MGTDLTVIEQEFEGYYRKNIAASFRVPAEQPTRLRVSSFPFCGLRQIYSNLIDLPAAIEYGSLYYTSVGTLVHKITQDFVGKGGRMFGNWRCVHTVGKKKCLGRRWFSSNFRCPLCKAPMVYREFQVKAFDHTSGHLDGIYQSHDRRFWLIDYKTSSTRVIRNNHLTHMLPYTTNVAQIRAYCALVETMLRIKISGWLLCYVARDNPMRTYKTIGRLISTEEKAKILGKIQQWDRHFGIVLAAKTLKDIQVLVAEKPCKTQEFYDLYYHDIEGCPLAANGMCFSNKRRTAALKEAFYYADKL